MWLISHGLGALLHLAPTLDPRPEPSGALPDRPIQPLFIVPARPSVLVHATLALRRRGRCPGTHADCQDLMDCGQDDTTALSKL